MACRRIDGTILSTWGWRLGQFEWICTGVRLRKEKTEVKIRYIDSRTNKAIQPQTEKLVPIGAHELFKPVATTGYQKPKAIEKTVGQKTVITFKYLPETYTIKVWYLDDITGSEVKVREYRSTYGAKLILPTYQQQGYHQNPGDTITVKGSETITYRLHRDETSTAMSNQSSVASQVSESAAQSVASPVISATSASVSASSASQATTPVTVTNGSNQLLADATLAKLQLYALAQDVILQFGDDGQAAGYDGTASYEQGTSHKMGLLMPGNVDVGELADRTEVDFVAVNKQGGR